MYIKVKAYLDAHSELTAEEWTELSGEEIYEDGMYIKLY
jgi:hypothetical protein